MRAMPRVWWLATFSEYRNSGTLPVRSLKVRFSVTRDDTSPKLSGREPLRLLEDAWSSTRLEFARNSGRAPVRLLWPARQK